MLGIRSERNRPSRLETVATCSERQVACEVAFRHVPSCSKALYCNSDAGVSLLRLMEKCLKLVPGA